MQIVKPIKRTKELAPLSRDHHSGLLLCWKIRTGIQKGISVDRIADYVVFYYENHLKEHFSEEEQYIFPLGGHNDEMVSKALDEHRTIVSLITKLENTTQRDNATLERLSYTLDAHIRFEERQLFPYIEQKAAKEQLGNVGDVIAELHKDIKEPAWTDEFWVRTA